MDISTLHQQHKQFDRIVLILNAVCGIFVFVAFYQTLYKIPLIVSILLGFSTIFFFVFYKTRFSPLMVRNTYKPWQSKKPRFGPYEHGATQSLFVATIVSLGIYTYHFFSHHLRSKPFELNTIILSLGIIALAANTLLQIQLLRNYRIVSKAEKKN